MSHNTLKVNTNSFDVNSNQSLSTSTSSSQFFCHRTFVGGQSYPRSVVVGQEALFHDSGSTNNINTITGLTVNYVYSAWIGSVTLSSAGRYRLYANMNITVEGNASYVGAIGYAWYDRTNNVQIGNNTYFKQSVDNYPHGSMQYGFIEVGSTPITVAVQITHSVNVAANDDSTPYSWNMFLIEKLQD